MAYRSILSMNLAAEGEFLFNNDCSRNVAGVWLASRNLLFIVDAERFDAEVEAGDEFASVIRPYVKVADRFQAWKAVERFNR